MIVRPMVNRARRCSLARHSPVTDGALTWAAITAAVDWADPIGVTGLVVDCRGRLQGRG